METPEEELEHPYIYFVTFTDNECNDACFCGGYILNPAGMIKEFLSLSFANAAIEDCIDDPCYSNCTFTVWRRPNIVEKVSERTSGGPGLDNHN